MPNGQWDSGRVEGCEGPLQILPSMHMLPLGSSLMPNGEWGSGKEGGGEEMYPPPSPNSDKKDEDNDENARAKNSSTHLLDTPTTHHGSVRPMLTKHPTLLFNNAEPHKGSQVMSKPSESTSWAQSMPTRGPNPSEGNDVTAPTLSAWGSKMTKMPPMSMETEPLLSKSSPLFACLFVYDQVCIVFRCT
jgi:hypothetical protein